MSNRERLGTVAVATVALVMLAMLAVGVVAWSEALAGQRTERTRIVCNPRIDVGAALRHPRRCTVLPPRASFSQGVNLARLRWRRWGSRRATFRGINKGFHLPPLHLRVRGYAYRLRRDWCGSGLALYTRVRYRTGGRVYTLKAQECYGND